ncbi:MAG: ATP-binding cassette domain-containing protein, partial [Conexibacteraceae bacterium]|nr:ATP-binding cassette domain-containing protein [Conexibacteraceae bacterium]
MSLKESSVAETAAAEAPPVAPAGVAPRLRLSDRAATGELAPAARERQTPIERHVVFQARSVSVDYGAKRAIEHVTMDIYANYATALIGPSGCGKSTFLRCLNRMNDSISGF